MGERKRSQDPHVHLGLRFAFYGRMSTSEYQDRYSSRLWQLEASRCLVARHGVVVAGFFDAGSSRRRRWSNRPDAARLLEVLADPDRGFDAIVVGEYERAFCGRQFDEARRPGVGAVALRGTPGRRENRGRVWPSWRPGP